MTDDYSCVLTTPVDTAQVEGQVKVLKRTQVHVQTSGYIMQLLFLII